jgi:hypothetical protein
MRCPDSGPEYCVGAECEAVEDGARRVGAVEGVEVDSGNVVVQEIVALFQGEANTDAVDRLAPAEALAPEISLPNLTPGRLTPTQQTLMHRKPLTMQCFVRRPDGLVPWRARWRLAAWSK